jgi:hypothetical protein
MTRLALVVGITDYDGLPSLTKPSRDAEAVARRLEKHGDFQVERYPQQWNPDKRCYEVAQERLTGKELGRILLEFLQKCTKNSEVLIYFSGHGITVLDELGQQKGYLAGSDCTIAMEGKQLVGQQYGVALDSLNTLISQTDFQSLVLLLDCCHAAYFLEGNSVQQTLNVFNYKPDCHLIAACRSFAHLNRGGGRYNWGYSAFTTTLLEGLLPENAGVDGQIRVDDLFTLIARKLEDKGQSPEEEDYQQPVYMGSGNSLALVSYPPKQSSPSTPEICPYPGLHPFDRHSSRFFFGRRSVVQMLRQKLEIKNVVPIIGTSGSGKTSIVNAGLIPLLDTSSWRIVGPMTPGNEPVEQLIQAFSQLQETPDLNQVRSLLNKSLSLNKIIKQFAISERVLLIIDQFEELFTQCENITQQSRFIQLITQVAETSTNQLRIIVNLQAEFLSSFLNEPLLTQLIQTQAVYVPPLAGEDLIQAIEMPASLQGYKIEAGLLETLQQDFVAHNRNLPLLQFTLIKLWESRDQQTHHLKLFDYENMGGMAELLKYISSL